MVDTLLIPRVCRKSTWMVIGNDIVCQMGYKLCKTYLTFCSIEKFWNAEEGFVNIQEEKKTSWDCNWAKLGANLIRTVLNKTKLPPASSTFKFGNNQN